MATRWQTRSLKQAGVILIDCDHRTPPAETSGLPYVTIPQIKDGRVELSGARLISESNFVEWTKKANPKANDVVLSRRCNPGESAYVPEGINFAVGQNLVLLRSVGELIHPPFLRWLIRGPDWWEQVNKFINVGAIFNSLKCGDIPNFELPIPPVEEQKRITAVLDSLDDKIELNRKTNETLEQMARAIFKSWFIDFDPVRSKQEGKKPFGMDDTTAALFPDSFEQSELGEIPKGWCNGVLEDLLVLQRGFDLPADKRTQGLYPVMAASGPSGYHNEFKVKGPGVTTGRSGLIGKVYYVESDFWPLNTSLWVKDFKNSTPLFAYYLLRLLNFETFNSGSAVPTLNRNHVHTLKMVVPPMRVIKAFDSKVAELEKLKQSNSKEIETLALTRDLLLPRLLSGELSVKESS